MISCGGDGAISVIANMYPAQFSSMVRSALEGDFATAARLNAELLDIHPWLYIENNPVGVKAGMEILGLVQQGSADSIGTAFGGKLSESTKRNGESE